MVVQVTRRVTMLRIKAFLLQGLEICKGGYIFEPMQMHGEILGPTLYYFRTITVEGDNLFYYVQQRTGLLSVVLVPVPVCVCVCVRERERESE